ncbi:hypothetical protein LWI29_037745 [Acer saccharum]|uniref:SWIM-type domain-containing protein n=1 Tax=Acer saccharum TaxID=4024 RepID=A0AA39RU07_ACESA|nr:hypothetical protein LWI29_037745 [Acer saccharum]
MNMKELESKDLGDSVIPTVEVINEKEVDNMSNGEQKVKLEVGMIFNSLEELFEYYKMYGNETGFQIIKRTSNKNDDGELKFVSFSCARNGVSKSNPVNAFKLQPMTKTGCKARLGASVCPDRKWRITSIIFEHNHELNTPGKVRYFKGNRIMKSFTKRKLEVGDRAGIRLNKNFNSFVVEVGGHDNLPFLEKDCRNYIDKIRRLRLGEGDAIAIQNYFLKMQGENSNFFYTIDLDEDGRLKNVLWVDARSRNAYKEFRDVITFDSTYLTNKYDMPFATFVGVNHHGQSILLGCGLVSNEDTKTYIWLFQSWLACMLSCPPKSIITDQDKAMKNAIEVVFPNTQHRWCLWHIMKKLPEKLRGYKEYEQIKFTLKNIVYDSITPEEFEERWTMFLENFHVSNNEWLNGLYVERQRWVPAFVKNSFWAGMSTTQRSESMHAFFNGYVNSKTSLKQFVEQYENALRDKVEKEKHADFNSLNTQIPCITHYAIEKQFQAVYTNAKFREFQQEVTGKLYCEVSPFPNDILSENFIVKEYVQVGEDNHRSVDFIVHLNEVGCEINCNCRLFESKGILCRHAIAVLIRQGIFCVPDKYILKRWRKDVKRYHCKVKISYDNWDVKPEGQRFDKMCNSFYEVADLATNNETKFCMVMEAIKCLKVKLTLDASGGGSGQCGTNLIEDIIGNGELNSNILTPRVVRSKGCPPYKRRQSKVEQIIRKKKKENKGR